MQAHYTFIYKTNFKHLVLRSWDIVCTFDIVVCHEGCSMLVSGNSCIFQLFCISDQTAPDQLPEQALERWKTIGLEFKWVHKHNHTVALQNKVSKQVTSSENDASFSQN